MTPFHLFSTAGNTTLFLEGPAGGDDLRRAMAVIPCEQAALADLPGARAVMAGGEFCVNACLAFAALLQAGGRDAAGMSMADQPVALRISGSAPCWQAEAEFSAAIGSVTQAGGVHLVKLPGIVHALIELDEGSRFPENAIAEAKHLWSELNLNDAPASGIIWWLRAGSGFEILPVVQVPAAATCNVEGACGSGSLALALLLPDGVYAIAQPSGHTLTVAKTRERLTLGGVVHLLARGELCLP